jgi:hypothetical protein
MLDLRAAPVSLLCLAVVCLIVRPGAGGRAQDPDAAQPTTAGADELLERLGNTRFDPSRFLVSAGDSCFSVSANGAV